jgi:hypothetical protein
MDIIAGPRHPAAGQLEGPRNTTWTCRGGKITPGLVHLSADERQALMALARDGLAVRELWALSGLAWRQNLV